MERNEKQNENEEKSDGKKLIFTRVRKKKKNV